jgi:hypothetical protein
VAGLAELKNKGGEENEKQAQVVFNLTRWISSYISYLSYGLWSASTNNVTRANSASSNNTDHKRTSTPGSDRHSLVRGDKPHWGKDNGLWAGNWCDLCQ